MSPGFIPFPRNDLSHLELGINEIQIWAVDLEVWPDQVQRWAATLSADERERADRFVFARDRLRFTVGRSVLRTLMARYTGVPEAAIRFRYADKGKPELAEGGLHFNVSHSEALLVAAFTRSSPLGIDVERARELPDAERIAKRFFSAVEFETLRRLPAHRREEGFFNCWTRKEAYVKAVGGGLQIPLDRFNVTLDPKAEVKFLAIEDDRAAAATWSLFHLEPKPGYIGALAIEGRGWQLSSWSLDAKRLLPS